VLHHTTRIVNGDKLWKSEKIRHLQPAHQAEYAWLLAFADPNGNFEYDPVIIHSNCYASNRPTISLAQLEAILEDFKKNGLLFTWEERGKIYAHFTGIEETLLPPKRRERYRTIPVQRKFPDKDEPGDPQVDAYMARARAAWNGNGHTLPPPTPEPVDETDPVEPVTPELRCKCHGSVARELIPLDAWFAFLDMRKAIGKPLYNVEHFQRRLITMHEQGEDIAEMLNYAIANNRPDVTPNPRSRPAPAPAAPKPAEEIKYFKPDPSPPRTPEEEAAERAAKEKIYAETFGEAALKEAKEDAEERRSGKWPKKRNR